MNKIKIYIFILSLLVSSFVTIKAEAAIITLRTDRDRLASSESVTLSGSITPRHKNIKINILGKNLTQNRYQKLATTKTNKHGKFSKSLTLDQTTYLKATYSRHNKSIKSKRRLITISDDLFLVAPYVNENEISSVNEAYSLSDNAPWGFAHPGVDFMISSGTTPVQAVTDGMIINVAVAKEDNQMGWHASFCITYGLYAPCYNLETFSSDEAIGDLQSANVFVTENQVVKQGDIIANLVYGGSGAHIDFGISYDNGRICPETYFSTAAQESIMRLITKDHPDWPMCYEE